MKILDLFSGAGGAGEGYARAVFEVTGVDAVPMPRNPHRFIQGDALEYVKEHGHEYDAIVASPPCQEFSTLKGLSRVRGVAHLLPATRELLEASGKPYIIENVPGAPMVNPVMLCGSMFELRGHIEGVGPVELRRHRLFESNIPLTAPGPCNHQYPVIGVYGGARFKPGYRGVAQAARDAMGIDWMRMPELSQAIPPAYTEWLGHQLMAAIRPTKGGWRSHVREYQRRIIHAVQAVLGTDGVHSERHAHEQRTGA